MCVWTVCVYFDISLYNDKLQLTFPEQDTELSLNHFLSTSASRKVRLLD